MLRTCSARSGGFHGPDTGCRTSKSFHGTWRRMQCTRRPHQQRLRPLLDGASVRACPSRGRNATSTFISRREARKRAAF